MPGWSSGLRCLWAVASTYTGGHDFEHQHDLTSHAPTTNDRNTARLLASTPPRPSPQPHITHTPKMPATTAETLSLVTRTVSVAPLVLLSAADHYGRQAKGTRKRVVGVLLGQNDGNNVRVSNSFAGVYMVAGPFAAEHRSGGGGGGPWVGRRKANRMASTV